MPSVLCVVKPLSLLTVMVMLLSSCLVPFVLRFLVIGLIIICGPTVVTVVSVDLIPGPLTVVLVRSIRCRRPSVLIWLGLMTWSCLTFVVVRHSVIGELRLLVLISSMAVVCRCCRLVILILGRMRRCVQCRCL